MRKVFACILTCLSVSVFAQTKTLKIATIAPNHSTWDIEERRLAQEWAQVTDKTIQIQFMGTTAMGGESGVIQKLNSVRPGQRAPIDGAIFTNLGIATLAPETCFLTLAVPFMFRNQEEVDLVLEKLFPRFQSNLENKGYRILGCFTVGWAYFYTKKPVHTPQDLKTQRLSVAGVGMPELINSFKAAGFTTIDITPDKLLQSMRSNGGCEGFYTIPLYAYAGQYYKSLPYIMSIPICPVIAAFVISEKTWSEIPDRYKADMLAAVKKAESSFVESQKTADHEYINRCVEEGYCTVVELSPEETRVMEETLKSDASAMIKTGLFDQKMYDDVMAILERQRNQ